MLAGAEDDDDGDVKVALITAGPSKAAAKVEDAVVTAVTAASFLASEGEGEGEGGGKENEGLTPVAANTGIGR